LPLETLWGFGIRSGKSSRKFRIWQHIGLDIYNMLAWSDRLSS
jgi:hypothetical protein